MSGGDESPRGKGGLIGPRRIVRSGPHATHHPDGRTPKSATGTGIHSKADWAAERPQPVTLRYYPKRVSQKPLGVVVVDAQNGGTVVAGPMRCCEAVEEAQRLNEQLRPRRPEPKPKKGKNKKHKK